MGLYLDHVNTVLAKLRETPVSALSTDATTEAYRAQEAVQRAVQRVWNAKQWSFKMREATFDTVAATADYYLTPECGEIYSIKSDTSPFNIQPLSITQFDRMVPDPTASGVPLYILLREQKGVQNQPTSAGVVSVSSSSASDTTQKVLVKGVVSGYVDVEELSLAGTGTVSGSKSFSSIISVSKSGVTVGAVTVVSGAVTIATLWPGKKTFVARKATLYPTPDDAYTITLRYFIVPPTLVNAYDDTQIPSRWDYVVDQNAFAFALQAKGQDQGAEFQTTMSLANKLLEIDMAREEAISSEDLIIPGDPTYSDGTGWYNYPSGYYPVREY